MGRLFTREALMEWLAFAIGVGVVFLVTGPWDRGFTMLMLGMGLGYWHGRFGRE